MNSSSDRHHCTGISKPIAAILRPASITDRLYRRNPGQQTDSQRSRAGIGGHAVCDWASATSDSHNDAIIDLRLFRVVLESYDFPYMSPPSACEAESERSSSLLDSVVNV